MAIGRYDAVEDEIHHGPGYFIQPVAVDPMDRAQSGRQWTSGLSSLLAVEVWRGGGVEGQSTWRAEGQSIYPTGLVKSSNMHTYSIDSFFTSAR